MRRSHLFTALPLAETPVGWVMRTAARKLAALDSTTGFQAGTLYWKSASRSLEEPPCRLSSPAPMCSSIRDISNLSASMTLVSCTVGPVGVRVMVHAASAQTAAVSAAGLNIEIIG